MRLSHSVSCFLVLFPLMAAAVGPFPGAAGQPGSTAIARNSGAFVAWADRVVEFLPGEALSEEWRDTSRALGPASGEIMDVVALGRGGSLTLGMALPIIDRRGPDFAVFGNAFSDFFLELAFVEVSSDGVHFVRFPNTSLTAAPIPAFGILDPTQVDGFAGKYRVGWGVPFDLADLRGLPGAEQLDFENVRYVRLVDVVGGINPAVTALPQSTDSAGRPIYDPFPTTGSAGFDLDGVGVFHPAVRIGTDAHGLFLEWRQAPGDGGFQLLRSSDLRTWTPPPPPPRSTPPPPQPSLGGGGGRGG
ncbi:MAG: hypothetical protein JJT96_18435 [Opitutales bacterium]|nr:hypothetical protein [Opitutales bacterium]